MLFGYTSRVFYTNSWIALALLAVICNACSEAPATLPAVKIEVSVRPDSMKHVARLVDSVLEGRTLVLYPDGNIAAIMYFHQGTQQGKQYWFRPDGKMEKMRFMQQGKETGRGYVFYPSGRLGFIDSIVQERRMGRYLEFYDVPNSPLHIYGYYSPADTSSKFSWDVEYDLQGRIISRQRQGQFRERFSPPLIR